MDWIGFVKHGLDLLNMDWTGFVKHGFVKYGFQNKYFVILFLEEIFPEKIRCLRLRLIIFGLSIPTLRNIL